MSYELKEVVGQTDNQNEKFFETPEGNVFRVKIEAVMGAINIMVLKDDAVGSIITHESISLNDNTGVDIKTRLEQRLTQAVRQAENTETNMDKAKSYLAASWGIDLDAQVQQPVAPMVEQTPIVKFLNSHPKDEGEE